MNTFYDLLFFVDGCYLKANKCLLSLRCPYFATLFANDFKESTQKVISLPHISRLHFSLILQYIYNDSIFLQSKDYESVFTLLILADYFILPRLVDV